MFKWKKLGKVFDPRDLRIETWMREFAQSPSAIVFEKYVRIYFCSRPAPDAAGQYRSYISFIDVDRKNMLNILQVRANPILELGKCGTFDEFGTYPVSVIQHEGEVRAYYSGFTRCESVPFNAAIGVAISHDGGEHFHRIGDGPVLSYSPDEPFLLGSPRVRRFQNHWLLWYVAGKEWLNCNGKLEPIYKIRMASSENGIDWIKQGKDLISDKLGTHECQACPDVTYRNGKYHMFFSYRDIQNYKRGAGGYRIGYAYSHDLANWFRNDEVVGISTSQVGWDSQMVNYPHLFELEGATYMLYQGNEMGREGFGLAVLENSDCWGPDEVA